MRTVLAAAIRRAVLLQIVLAGVALSLSLSAVSAQAADGSLTVYTESNAPNGNELLVFVQREDGSLALTHSISAHGFGSGGGLSNQGAVALSPRGSLIFAVNAASNTIASFKAEGEEIDFVTVPPTGAQTPFSLTKQCNLLYVRNRGSDAITGLRRRADGWLGQMSGS